jgi:SAM-dependent methyltransferase
MSWDESWDEVFGVYEWGRYPAEDLVRFVARNFYRVKDRSKIRLLEVGCGPGANIWYMAREGFSTFGIDGSEVAIGRARQRLADEGLAADLRIGDIMVLPYENEFFDGVVDIECIYTNDLHDSLVILQEIRRVLKPGGLFYSRTFMIGTAGEATATAKEGEPRTYLRIHEGPLSHFKGLQRFSSDGDIKSLYGLFTMESLDHLIRTDRNRSYEIREYMICCRKA